MEVAQVYELVNSAMNEAIGAESTILAEDLSNVVEVGRTLENAGGIDAYARTLPNVIGKMYFNNRRYTGEAPSVMRESWEFGSILARVTAEMPEAEENESWALEDGAIYSNEQFYKPVVSAKFFNRKITFEVPMSYTTMQIKQSFHSAEEMNAFLSMLYTAVENSMTIKTEQLIKRGIANMIALTVHDEYGSALLASKSTIKAVNLLYEYNTTFSQSLTVDDALTDPDFIKYACFVMKNYIDRIHVATQLFNIDEKVRFTSSDRLHWILHSEFKNGADVYLQSETFHNEFTKLPEAEPVTFWQNVGDFSFSKTSEISVKTTAGDDVSVSGILGVMFDTYAIACCNVDRRTTSAYNAKAEFYNNYYKSDMELINCTDENFVVFFVA